MFLQPKTEYKELAKKIYSKEKFKWYIELIIGALLLSISFNVFCRPNNLVSGGISGLSIITEHLFSIDPSTFIIIVDILLLIISYFLLGKEKTINSILGSLLFPVLVKLTANIGNYIQIESNQILLSTLFAGIIQGTGAGLIFKAGFTSGGTDIINQILSKYFKISIGNAMYFSDGLIVLISGIVFGVNKIMYAVILIYLISYIADRVILGISDSKAFYIITKEENKIKEFIIKELHHSVTVFKAKGGYLKENTNVLMCVLPTKEYYKFKEGILTLDKSAFFVVTDAYQVVGGE